MRILGILCLCTSLLLAACSQEPEFGQTDAFIHSDASFGAGETYVSAQPTVIASLNLDNGNVVRFIDEQIAGDEPKIGVVEFGQAGTTSALSRLEGENPSPLELYMALAPGRAAPAELTLHHQKLAQARSEIPLEPRKLIGSVAAQGVEVNNYCQYELPLGNHFDFVSWVSNAFGAALPRHGHGHNLTYTHYGVTGKSSKRALGTCNAAGYVKSVKIDYQFAENLWVNVPLGVSWLFPGQFLFYYSDNGYLVPQTYRIKVAYTVEGNRGNTAHTEGSW